MRGLYKYPQMAYPYGRLVEENGRRGRRDPELELLQTGAFDESRYWDVAVEYAKADTDDILIRITASNRGREAAGGRRVLRRHHPGTPRRGRQARDAPGARRDALVEAVVSLRRAPVARGRSGPARAPAGAQGRPQPRVDASLQR